MTPQTAVRATLDDLHGVEGKAELIGGVIVRQVGTGYRPVLIAARIYLAFARYVGDTKRGVAFTDGIAFTVPELRSGRESFSPDATYHVGVLPSNPDDFVPAPPTVAVEVRSKGDYGPKPEREMADKRADYFEAGTAVVWDVNPRAGTVTVYAATTPGTPRVFAAGGVIDAEPAMPGFRLAVAEVFGEGQS